MDREEFMALPHAGAWRLIGAYEGFEVVRFNATDDRIVLVGTTVGVEDGVAWTLDYEIVLTSSWHVRSANISDGLGNRLEIEGDGAGSWTVNGGRHPELDGCVDLDLEASAVTNTIPVHRLALAVGHRGESAAVYIRTTGLVVERLDQTYRRLADERGLVRFEYSSPRFGYHDTLRFGPDGLVVVYPDIGERVPLNDS